MGHTALIFLINLDDIACGWRGGRVPFR